MSIIIIKGLYQSVSSYLSYEVNVNYKSLIESPSEFPAVSICNLDPFDVTTESVSGTYYVAALSANKISPEISLSTNDTAVSKVDEAVTLLKAYIAADKSITSDFRKKLSFTMSTMLISCYYNGIQCSAVNFSYFRTFDYGNCFTFNGLTDGNGDSQDAIKTSKAGPSNGLSLELFVGAPGLYQLLFSKIFDFIY